MANPNALVSLQEFKRRIRKTDKAEDQDLALMLEEAQEVVLDYVKQRRLEESSPTWEETVDAWDDQTVPRKVRTAILRQAAEFYRFRGDDETGPVKQPGRLSDLVESLLVQYRDPTVA